MTILRTFCVISLLSACLLAGTGVAGTITLTLDDVSVGTCETPWTEAGCQMWFTETTAEDRTPGFCMFVAHAEMTPYVGVYIWPGRLVVDLSTIEGVESVEVDVYETHFPGSTRAFLYSDGSTVSSMQSFQEDLQTLTVPVGSSAVDLFAVSAHESYVFEIRIIGSGITDNAALSLGALKVMYR